MKLILVIAIVTASALYFNVGNIRGNAKSAANDTINQAKIEATTQGEKIEKRIQDTINEKTIQAKAEARKIALAKIHEIEKQIEEQEANFGK